MAVKASNQHNIGQFKAQTGEGSTLRLRIPTHIQLKVVELKKRFPKLDVPWPLMRPPAEPQGSSTGADPGAWRRCSGMTSDSKQQSAQTATRNTILVRRTPPNVCNNQIPGSQPPAVGLGYSRVILTYGWRGEGRIGREGARNQGRRAHTRHGE